MSDITLFVLGILLLTVVVPRWISLHYEAKRRAERSLDADDQRALVELGEVADRMERRIQSLERILDAEVPNWRSKA